MPPLRPAFVAMLALLFAPLALAQFPSPVNNDTRTPVPGSGHDYIHMLTETVDPSNGSLTVHISTPVPPSRGTTIPFSFDYSSGAVKQVEVCSSSGSAAYGCWAVPTIAGVVLTSGGWSYRIPELTANQKQVTCHYYGGSTGTTDVVFDYMFMDPSGTRHNLGMAHTQTLNPNCSYGNQQPYNVSTGGDDFYQATLNQTTGAVAVAGADGTVYNFPVNTFGGFFGVTAWLPSTSEDRNGNIVTFSGSTAVTETDTAHRSAVSTSAAVGTNGTVSISGVPNVYTVAWETISSSYGSSYEQLGNGSNDGCNWSGNRGANVNVVKSIELPNGTYYTFGYDSNGLLNQITYPTGAVVNYTWATSSPNGQIEFFPPYPNNQYECVYGYYAPMVTQRTVKFDGVHTALVQNFSYTTAFGAGVEQATVQTTVYSSDGSTNRGTFKTVYNYAYIPAAGNSDPDDWVIDAAWVPVEQTVQHYDYGETNLIETVTEGWQDQFLVGCRLETHDGSALRGTFYSYGAGAVLTDQKEYDYGQINSTSECPQAAQGGPITAPSSPAPLRETVATYQSFADTPIFPSSPSILDRPATVKTYLNGTSGTLEAETDYTYGTATSSVSSTQHDETNYSSTSTAPRGNATTVVRKCLQSAPACSNGNPTTTYAYYETGQTFTMVDPCGNTTCSDTPAGTTTYIYTDSYTSGTPPGNTNAYLTKVTYPATGVAHVESYSYSYADGELTKSVDENSQPTTYTYNTPPSGCSYGDGLDRLSLVVYPPGGGQTTYCYDDAAPNPTVTTTKEMTSSQNFVSVDVMDGMGQHINTEIADPAGTDSDYRILDGLGLTFYQYNPYRSTSDPTYGYTTYVYDALGRSKSITDADGSVTSTTYSGNCSTVTDEAGKTRESCTDGLDRLTEVIEDPGSSPHLNYVTNYTYDALDDLLSVVEDGSRNRSFSYDSLGRLTTSVNPESGTINYIYDANGNVMSKTAPLPDQTGGSTVTITNSYDALNRLIEKTYSNGMTANQYYYDQASHGYSVGHLTHDSNDVNAAYDPVYDQMGRVTSTTYCIPSDCSYDKNTVETYDLAGDLTSYTNAAGVTITQTFDAARHLTQVTSSLVDSQHPATLATFTYFPSGAVKSTSYGNGLTQTEALNTRLQPCRTNVNSSGTLLNTCTDSTPSGTLLDLTYGWNAGTSDNGNLATFTAAGQQVFNRTYGYTSLNQLSSMSDSDTVASCQGATWSYDPWGNRTAQTPTKGSCGMWSSSYTANNQISSYSYDAAGNLLNDGTHGYTYDAENRISAVASTATYVYDADGKRVSKTTGGVESDYIFDPSGNPMTIYGSGCGNSCWARGYIYANGREIAEYGSSTTYFVTTDHLGSTRLMTAMNQSVYDSMDYMPFGEQMAGGTGSTHKFTGKERDSETNLDNFGARYNSSSLGRFMSPDPVVITTERLEDPQQFNLYAYVANNPVRFIDPTGEFLQCNGSTEQQKQCFSDLQQIAGDAANRLSMDAKTGVISFDTKDLDLSKNEGATLVNDLVGSKNTYDLSIGPTIMTDKGPVRVDKISYNMANLPAFGDQTQMGNPPSGVSDIVGLNLNNPNMTRVSNTNLKVAPEWTVAFHELAEAYAKIDGGMGGSYAAGHNAALQREMELRDQRPYLKEYNTGAGGPANAPNPQGGIIIKR